MEEYLAWKADKKKAFLTGAIAIVASILMRLLGGAGLDAKTAVEGSLLISILAFGVGLFGVLRILDAKAQPRLWALIGYFALFLPDRNKRWEPSRSGTGYKPEGAAFSDW